MQASTKQTRAKQVMEEPWRSFGTDGDWTREYCYTLIQDIKEIKPIEEIKAARIAIFGIVSSGKSSFINSIACIDKGRIVAEVNMDLTKESVTREFSRYVPTRLLTNFILLDAMGIEAEDETKHVNVGNLQFGYKFSAGKSFQTQEPRMECASHCIVIVMDARLIDTESVNENHLKKIEILQKHARDADVRTILLLTKIDLVCPELNKDLKNVFYCRKMKDIVFWAKNQLRLTPMQIFPVRNYSEEQDLNLDMDILLLLALRQMVRFANDRIDHMANQKFGENFAF